MPDWNSPKWVNEGRTGPNGPKYAHRKDRAMVRKANRKREAIHSDACLPLFLVMLGGVVTVGVAIAAGIWQAVT